MSILESLSARPLVGGLVVAHAVALALGAAWGLTRRPGAGKVMVGAFAASFLVNTAVLAVSWAQAGRAPIKTLYETMLLYPWCVGLVTLALLGLYRLKVLVPFSSAVSLAGLLYAAAKPDAEFVNLPPALQSGWFIPHVVTYFVAYAGLFASAVLAVCSMARPAWSSERGETFEQYAHRAAMFGFTALTLGLVMGGAWGKEAWGDYWSWDPKENWALVSFLAYLGYFHLRLMSGWQGRRAMAALVVSFAAVVFTYLGMSLLPSASDSLHVYQ